ncbi:oligosaccharide flippase family protein [Sphingoaurantiacus capsulatus]|uniref:Oligosaccharide flippase family protein n=1 Tax=Sphingoaurantiacus capsulatus TaxID=1771310 RepID=A0ABV7XEM9_9SPHN
MTDTPTALGKQDVARGAGSVALSRMGALIDALTQPIYTWLFGIATYGLYTVLWAWVNLVSNCVDMGFTSALQRVVPQADSETRAHAALKLALIIGVLPSVVLALATSLAAAPLAELINVAPKDRPALATGIMLFAWALPLWTFVEIATSALRARRAFGPEIRLRIFWEQVVRLALALALFAAGFRTLGLLIAHLGSLFVTAGLSLRLLARYYDLRLAWRAPFDRAALADLLLSGFSVLPANISRRIFQDGPPILLNLMVPGAGGATAAGLYGIARKIASIPQIIRLTFLYVMAPLASAQAAVDRTAIQPLYAFSTRLSTVLVLPLAVALILLGDQILDLFGPGAEGAFPILVALVIGRAVETVIGAAGPVLETTGHRGLPLLNALVGLAVWTALSFVLVPDLAGTGMAIAVAAGWSVAALLAIAEVRIADGLRTFTGRMWQGLAISAATGALMWGADRATAPLGDRVEAAVVLLLFVVSTWIGLRFGLSATDREALGGIGRRLKLTR